MESENLSLQKKERKDKDFPRHPRSLSVERDHYDQEESLSRHSRSPSPELYPDGTRKGKSKAN